MMLPKVAILNLIHSQKCQFPIWRTPKSAMLQLDTPKIPNFNFVHPQKCQFSTWTTLKSAMFQLDIPKMPNFNSQNAKFPID